MRAIERGLDSLGFLPDALREALRRRLRELGGVALIVLAMLLALALATWSVQDPSLSHATTAPIRNVLGISGAIVADLLMQLFGVAALALVLPVAVWGWRLATHRPLRRERMRLIFWVLGVLLAASFASCLPRTPSWPLPAGLGGVIGDGLLRLPGLLTGGTLSGMISIVVACRDRRRNRGLLCDRGRLRLARRTMRHFDADEARRAGRGARVDLARLDHPWLSQSQGAAGALVRARRAPRAASRGGRRTAPAPSRASRTARPRCSRRSSRKPTRRRTTRTRRRARRASRRRRPAGAQVGRIHAAAAGPAGHAENDRTRHPEPAGRCRTTPPRSKACCSDFGVRGEIINARPGPVVTLYELEPAPGINRRA